MNIESESNIHRSKVTIDTIETTKRTKRRKRTHIKNRILRINQFCLMTFLLSSILSLLLLLDSSPFSQASDYLYTDDKDLDKSQRGGVRVVDPEDDKDVWPIMDYIKPKQKSLESDALYKERLLNPVFLTDQYDRPRVVEFYAPWCGVSDNLPCCSVGCNDTLYSPHPEFISCMHADLTNCFCPHISPSQNIKN